MQTRLLVLSMVSVLSACGGADPAVMEFVELLPPQPRLGEVVTVRFRMLDERGAPLAGAPVTYRLGSENTGVTLSPESSVSIKGTGFAETQVVANGRVNSIIVTATSGNKSVNSPPITFAGAVPNGRQFTFQCGPFGGPGSGGRHAIGAYDETRYLIAGISIDCTAHVADRNGDGVEGALVSFLTEAGAIGPTDTSQANLVGDATVLHKTALPLPLDVDPGTFTWVTAGGEANNTGEYLAPLWMHPFNWMEDPRLPAFNANAPITKREPRRPDPIREKPDGSGRFQNNPRDNLVSMIAVTSGEEGFTDQNNNGQYDQGEPFDDLTEPFVDYNDNGTWDEFEKYIDVNGNNTWNGKNGRWDANTLIWVQERLLWTGLPAAEDRAQQNPQIPGFKSTFAPINPPVITLVCPNQTPGAFCSQAGIPLAGSTPLRVLPVTVTAYIADPWFNSIARNGDGDSCEIPPEAMAPIKVRGSSFSGAAFTYPAGEFLAFAIGDARDPNLPPINQIPVRDPPVGFRNTIICTYTAAPENSYITKLAAGNVEGTIQ